MHKVVYLPLAESDILDAVDYIANKLDAPKAAADLLSESDRAVQQIAMSPYVHKLYRTNRPMRDEVTYSPGQ